MRRQKMLLTGGVTSEKRKEGRGKQNAHSKASSGKPTSDASDEVCTGKSAKPRAKKHTC